MWLRLLRSRPVHMAIVSGISVYVLLTIFGMMLHESEHTNNNNNKQQRYIAAQHDHRGMLNLREPEGFDTNRVRVISSDVGNKQNVLVAAPPDDSNFIFGAHVPAEAQNQSQDKLDQIANLLKDVEAKMNVGEEKNPDIRHDIRDIKNSIKELMGKKGDVEVAEDEEHVKAQSLLEEPKDAEPPGKVTIDELPFLQDPQAVPSLCPKTVQTLAKYSKWFHDRYQHGIKLFADFEDVRAYNNFHKLDHYTLPFGFRRTKRQQMAAILNHPNFTNAHLFQNNERPHCLRCAVVGCGGILNGSKAGPEIDSHDLVFRLNRALSSGRFADDVGVKTSFYTFFPESMHATDVTDENALYVYTMFKQYDIDYMENIVRDLSPPIYTQKGKQFKLKKPPIRPDRLKLLHPDFSRYVFTHFLDGKSHRPTTGALVVMLAVHICDEVTIYGFGYDKRFTLHYYDKAFVNHTDKSTALHDVDNERGLWNKLHEEGVIRFFKRDL